MLTFQMFRVGVRPTRPLLGLPEGAAAVLGQAIKSLPSIELRQGRTWHIGNVKPLGGDALYFRVGRISHSTMAVYDGRGFRDQEFETAPYTHVVLDLALEVCALARQSRLAPTAQGIARQLAALLNRSETARGMDAAFDIAAVFDPEDFVTYLTQASAVSRFWVTFKRPNPFDAEKDFQRPLQSILAASGGDKGRAQLEGESLIVENLEKMARAAAATGDDAAATMALPHQRRRVVKRLRENPVVLTQEDLESAAEQQQMLTRMRDEYRRIRGSE